MIKEYASAKELTGLPLDDEGGQWPGTERGVLKRTIALGIEKRRRPGTKAWEYLVSALPEITQTALYQRQIRAEQAAKIAAERKEQATTRATTPDELWAWYDRRPGSLKDEAAHRLVIVQALAAALEDGQPLALARCAIAAEHGVSDNTLHRWWQRVKDHQRHDWLPLLVPHTTGRTATAPCANEAWEFFKADYLRLEQPSAAACYQRLQRAAAEHGWGVPSLKTLLRRIRKLPATVRILTREGENALLRTYPAQQRTVQALCALEWINGDGYQHNVFVRWPDGSIARPKTWFWQDVYSRMLLAYRTDTTEHTELVRLSFGDLVERYGIPGHATIDNTRAAANKWMTGGVANRYRFKIKEEEPLGVFAQLGVQVHWTSVFKGKGHGQAKPIERAFGVGGMGEMVDKHPAFSGAWTGNNPQAKPEDYGRRAVPIDTFNKVLADEVRAFNARTGRRTEICGGVLSFEAAFNESYQRATITKARADQRRLWLLAAEHVTVQRDGSVTLDAGALVGQGRNRYYSGALLEWAGHGIVVRFDPQSLHGEVYCYHPDGRYIDAAVCIENAGFGDADAGREHSRARRSFMKAAKEQAAAEQRMDALETARYLPVTPESEVPHATVIRPVFEPPPRTPHQDPCAKAQAQATLAAARAQPAPVAELVPPPEKYRRWLALDARIRAAGDDLSAFTEWEKYWHQSYPNCAEYRTQKLMYDNPLPTPSLPPKESEA